MKIKDSTALVTGANRGIGKAYVEALIKRGAKKVYAAMRDVEAFKTSSPDCVEKYKDVLELIPLDITHEGQVASAVKGDVELLINNAGIANFTGLIAGETLSSARQEMEVNYFGTLSMIRAFAPVLKENGGGAIANVLSVASLANFPVLGSYSASKAALYSLTQGVRAELAHQGTHVLGVYPGPIDTDMAKDFPMEKSSPEETANGTLQAIEEGQEDIFIDIFAIQFQKDFQNSPIGIAKQFAEMLPESVS
ncbi:MAG: SDR family oxidoreductase [Nitrospina sp.]|jgi:short-subunit dehydrogenase|nr:SDR family oxidoreductase [Nitrospina sp.]MBT5633564.1 SDR family oxidoreductase [Nitrospina sp.]